MDIKIWLLYIQQSIEEISEFLGDHRDFFAYQKDLKTKKSVERNLEKLSGNYNGFYSIRVNDQWRIIFQWKNSNTYEVKIIDYH